jgi:hypothetical protein
LSLDEDWHIIRDLDLKSLPGDAPLAELTRMLDASSMDPAKTEDLYLLQSTRDYRHYFRVRSYTINDLEERCYSRSPAEPTFSSGAENVHIKWAYRKIMSHEEFAAAAAINFGISLQKYGDPLEPAVVIAWPPSVNFTGGSKNSEIKAETKSFTDITNSALVYKNLYYCIGSMADAFAPAIAVYGAQFFGSLIGMTQTFSFKSPDNAYNGNITISEMKADSVNNFGVEFNGATRQVDPKHYRPAFTFGSPQPNLSANEIKWHPERGLE